MKNSKILVVILVLLALIAIFFIVFLKERPEVCINHSCFNVEIADNLQEMQKGLSLREELKDNSGMIFVFPHSGNYSFWMKDTFIPLDIIWIDENKNIVFISEKNQPCNETCLSIYPDKEALYVLEINSGLVEKYNITRGNNVWMHLV